MATLDVKLKELQDRYATLASLAQKAGFPIDPLDPLAVKCSVGDSCCAGGDKTGLEDRILTAHEHQVVEEVQSLRAKYADLVSKIATDGNLSPKVIDLADSCGCGDACHTGTTDKLNSLLDEISVHALEIKSARNIDAKGKKPFDLREQYASLAKKVAQMQDVAVGSIDLVGYTCHGGEHCHGGSNRQLDRLELVSTASKMVE
jgi:hypothetical protein